MFTLAALILSTAQAADATPFPKSLPPEGSFENEPEPEVDDNQAEFAAWVAERDAALAAGAEPAAQTAAPEPATAHVASATSATAHVERIESTDPPPRIGFTHGFRIGYSFVRLDGADTDPLASSHLVTVGYEVQQRIIGGGWLNVLMIENVMVSGINPSRFIPTANLLLGFEFKDSSRSARA